MTLRSLLLVLSVPALILATAPPTFAARGYESRACGLDMNRNGIIGEAADCNVCDGSTRDPDGDGVNEDLIYVDCNGGSDSSSCGSPGSPCKTIRHAWNVVADGPGDGAEDIICFKGTCKSEKNTCVGSQGASGTYTVKKSGSEQQDWVYSKNPTMLVGWDADDDGKYPPFDSDDVAVVDGGSAGSVYAFQNCSGAHHVELGHFTVKDYGKNIGPGQKAGVFTHAKVNDDFNNSSRHVYLHDLKLEGICEGQPKEGSCVTFRMLPNGFTQIAHWNVTNVNADRIGSYFSRFGCGNEECGPYRWKNITYRSKGCSEGSCPSGYTTSQDEATTFAENWRLLSKVEFLDNDLSLHSTYRPSSSGPTFGIVVPECVQEWWIVNNRIANFGKGIILQPDDATSQNCNRRVDRIVIDRNWIVNDSSSPDYGNPVGVYCSKGASGAMDAVHGMRVTNNLFSTSQRRWSHLRFECGFDSSCGGNPLGQLFVANNTFRGSVSGGAMDFEKSPCSHQNIVVKNNLVSGLGSGDDNVEVAYAPSGWQASHNIYDDAGRWTWNASARSSLSNWQSASGGDSNAKQCSPSFVNVSSGDLHLTSGACAIDAGADLSAVFRHDLDGGARPAGASWDIGADEFNSGDDNPPPPPPDDEEPPPPPPPDGEAPAAPTLIEVVPLP